MATIKLDAIYDGELRFSINGVSGDPEICIRTEGVDDGVTHLEWCLEQLFKAGKIRRGAKLATLRSESSWVEEEGWEVPTSTRVVATTVSGRMVEVIVNMRER